MSDDDPKTPTGFGEALAELVRDAAENGVAVEGGWAIRDPDADREWSVEITRVRTDD